MYQTALFVVFVFVAVVPVPAGTIQKRCSAGYHVGPDGQSCLPCPPKHYMPENDHTYRKCWQCDDEPTQHGDGEQWDSPCTWTNNTKKICIPSKAFRDELGNCMPCRRLCGRGEIETTPCMEHSDRVCQASTSTQAPSDSGVACNPDKERNGDGTGDSPTPMGATVATPKPTMPPPEYDGKRSSIEPVPKLENDNSWESVYFWVILGFLIVIIVIQVITMFICWKFWNKIKIMSFCRAGVGGPSDSDDNGGVQQSMLVSNDSGLSTTSTFC